MDWDNDGLLDIIVGDREGGVNYFRRLSSDPLLLLEGSPVEVAGAPVKLPHNSAPSATDWNGDGLTDLVIGRSEGIPGGLFLLLNEGQPGEPLFSEIDTLTQGGEPIQVYYAYPDFHDMDSDGLEDLVVGSSTGKIGCFLNIGSAQAPEYAEMVYLQSEGEDINFYSYIRPSVCDWNDDGCPDLLASDYNGFVYLMLGDPETGITHGPAPGVHSWSSVFTNPASGSLSLSVNLHRSASVATRLYSMDGRLLLDVRHGELAAGEHALSVDVSGMHAGVLLLESTAEGDGTGLPPEHHLVTINIR